MGMTSRAGAEILCIGEILWDGLPEGLFLGGAPFNVACHLSVQGENATIVSRVGRDRLGDEALRRATHYGVGTDLMQVDDSLPTGFVTISVDAVGNAQYEILAPAAWDAIHTTDPLVSRAEHARAVVFGSLAQRSSVSRETITRCVEVSAMVVFDVNLRRPYCDQEVVRQSLHHADVAKLSSEELDQVAHWFGITGSVRERCAALAEMFGCSVVCVTQGRGGAAMWRDGRWTEHPGFRVQVRDTVGAGDAFLASLLVGLLEKADDETILVQANRVGASVAAQAGALPARPSPDAAAPATP